MGVKEFARFALSFFSCTELSGSGYELRRILSAYSLASEACYASERIHKIMHIAYSRILEGRGRAPHELLAGIVCDLTQISLIENRTR